MTPHSSGNDDPPLSEEDRHLWDMVARTVKPVHPSKKTAPPARKSSPVRKQQLKTSTAAPPTMPRLKATPVQQSREMDRRTEQRLRRGKIAIDVTLDLHGMIQETAQHQLIQTLSRAYQQNARLVLVITGKGTRSQAEGGILRRRVPEWCDLSPLSDMVLNISSARPQHGGTGAYYIYLRRRRSAG